MEGWTSDGQGTEKERTRTDRGWTRDGQGTDRGQGTDKRMDKPPDKGRTNRQTRDGQGDRKGDVKT